MGLGSIERPEPHKGGWRVRVWWQAADGARRSTRVWAPTEKGALAVARARQAKEAQDAERERAGLLVRRRACPTLTEYVLEHHAAIWPHARVAYLRRQLATLGTHVEPHLGPMRLDTITRAQVAQVLSKLRTAGLSGASSNRVLSALSKVMAHAVDAGLLAANVCRGRGSRLTAPEAPQAVEHYSLEEVGRIVEAAQQVKGGSRWGPFIAVAAFTGARPSSVQRLKVGDVHLERTPPVLVFRETKSGKDLEVPLVGRLVELLEPHVTGRAPDEWLFPGGVGGAGGHIGEGYEPVWLRATSMAGVRCLTFYALRRSFITGAIDAGVSLTTVRDLAGHSTLAITNRYAGSQTRREQATALAAAWGTHGANVVQSGRTGSENEPTDTKT